MKTTQYFVRLLGTRSGWPDNMTSREEKIMAEHFEYLKRLTEEGKVLMAGPCFSEPPFGLIVLNVADDTEARTIMDIEPSVTGGVHTYEMFPLRVALMADKVR